MWRVVSVAVLGHQRLQVKLLGYVAWAARCEWAEAAQAVVDEKLSPPHRLDAAEAGVT
jgi:hypothetical protein